MWPWDSAWVPCPLDNYELKHPGMITKLVDIDGGFYYRPPEGDPAREQFVTETELFCDYIETWEREEKEYFASFLLTEYFLADLLEFVEYFYEFPS